MRMRLELGVNGFRIGEALGGECVFDLTTPGLLI